MNLLDLFSGTGGFSYGFQKQGINPVAFCENELYAQEVLKKHWPTLPIFNDVTTLTKSDLSGLDFDIITGGFPCFTDDVMVLCKDGYKSIKDVQVGDLVLTHEGRWKRVNQKHKKRNAPTRVIKAQGVFPITTTDEHPFYTKGHTWVDAKDLKPKQHMLGFGLPIDEKEILDKGYNFWWIIGRFIADGWLVNRLDRGDGQTCKTIICCGKDEQHELEKYLYTEFNATKVEERTVFKYHITKNWFGEFLKPIGRGASNKQIPPEWLHLSKDKAKALLDGYFSGDGSKQKKRIRATTVSKKLALGIASLVQKVYGVSASLYTHEVEPTTVIEGRTVNQKTQYCVAYTERSTRTSSVEEGRFVWKKLKENMPTGKTETVYNIGVEDDESYIVNGCVVHNCQDISISGKNSGINGERSGLWKEFMRIIDETQPKYAVFENVFALCSRGLDQLLQEFAKIGYDACWTTLDTQFFGLPQRRRRVYIFAVRDGIPIGADPFDFEGRDSAELKQEIIHFKESREWDFTQSSGDEYAFAYFTRQRSNKFDTQGVASTIAKRDHKDFTDLILDEHGLRKLAVEDRLALQGYPRDFFDGVKLTTIQSYQLNGMSINVIEWLAKRIKEFDNQYGK